jgi:hypothetical protein
MTLCEAYAAFGITRYIDVAPVEAGSGGKAKCKLTSLVIETRDNSRGADAQDEEEIIRAAAEIRRRRICEHLGVAA